MSTKLFPSLSISKLTLLVKSKSKSVDLSNLNVIFKSSGTSKCNLRFCFVFLFFTSLSLLSMLF